MEGVWASRLVQRQVADARRPVLVNRHDRSGFELARVSFESSRNQRGLLCRFVHPGRAKVYERGRAPFRLREQRREIRISRNDYSALRRSSV